MATKKPRGRPRHGNLKLTPKIHADIVKWIAAGNYMETAAHLANVNKTSVYSWLKRGHRENTGIFRDFLNAVKKAEAEAEARLVLILEKAASNHWQAAAWRLERKYPKRWGRKDSHELVGNKRKPLQTCVTDETIQTIRAKVLGIKE